MTSQQMDTIRSKLFRLRTCFLTPSASKLPVLANTSWNVSYILDDLKFDNKFTCSFLSFPKRQLKYAFKTKAAPTFS